MEAIHPAPMGISYKTLGSPFASIERRSHEVAAGATANMIFPSAAQRICCKYCHFQFRTGSTVTFRSEGIAEHYIQTTILLKGVILDPSLDLTA